MLTGMTSCTYCARTATMTIIANPPNVCAEHAYEFWTGLLDYTSGRAPCVKEQGPCSCQACEELSAKHRRAVAAAGIGPSPADHASFPAAGRIAARAA